MLTQAPGRTDQDQRRCCTAPSRSSHARRRHHPTNRTLSLQAVPRWRPNGATRATPCTTPTPGVRLQGFAPTDALTWWKASTGHFGESVGLRSGPFGCTLVPLYEALCTIAAETNLL